MSIFNIDDAAEAYAKVLNEGFAPDHMIVADERILSEAGLAPGTWFLQKGQEPVRIGDAQQFEQVGYSALLRREVNPEELAVA